MLAVPNAYVTYRINDTWATGIGAKELPSGYLKLHWRIRGGRFSYPCGWRQAHQSWLLLPSHLEHVL